MLFTLDKLIYKLVKQFQALQADEIAQVGAPASPSRCHSPASRKRICCLQCTLLLFCSWNGHCCPSVLLKRPELSILGSVLHL